MKSALVIVGTLSIGIVTGEDVESREGLSPSQSQDEGRRIGAVPDAQSDVSSRVRRAVVEHLGVEIDRVNDRARFIEDLGADSLDIVELVMASEEEFNIEIPDDAAEKLLTVGDAIRFIEKALTAEPSV